MKMINYTDDCSIINAAYLSDCLSDLEKDEKWVDMSISDMTMDNIAEGPLFLEEVKDRNKLTASDESILDTMENSGVCISDGKDSYLLSRQAFQDMIFKFGASCPSFYKSTLTNKLDILRIVQPVVSEKKVKCIVRKNKVRAILSSSYSNISSSKILKMITEKFDSDFEDSELISSIVSHDIFAATWKLNDKTLTKKYLEVASSIEGLKDAEPCITVVNSNTGHACIQLLTQLKANNLSLTLGKFKMRHSSSVTEDDFKEALGSIFTKMNETFKNIDRLQKIEIKHPVDCLVNIANYFKVPKKNIEAIMPIYETMIAPSNNATAVWTGLGMLSQEIIKPESRILFDESIYRVLNSSFHWNEFDKVMGE